MDIEKKDLGKAIATVATPEVYDAEQTYERLTYVKHNGHVYLSKQDVPIGVSPTGGDNDEYWLDYEIAAASCRLGRAYTCNINYPNRPTGGSYSSPSPVEDEWKAEPYDCDYTLWYSERLFTEDGRNQDAEWSMPAQLTHNQYIETRYSNLENNPGNPDDNPDNWVETTTDFVWIAIRSITNGIKNHWNISRVIGKTGPQGAPGKDGKNGTNGKDGKNFTILGYKDSLEQLQADVPNPNQGDAYGVGTDKAYEVYVYDTVKGWVNNGYIGNSSSKVNTDKVFVVNTIPVAGGPLSDVLNKAGITEISAEDNLQDVLLSLFTKEIYPTNLNFVEGSIKASIVPPTFTLSHNGNIEIGTVVTISEITLTASTQVNSPRKYTGFTYGYSAANDNTKDSSNNTIQVNASNVISKGDKYTMTRKIGAGSPTSPTSNINPASVKLSSMTFECVEGTNTVKVDVTGTRYSCTFAQMPVYYACSNLGKTSDSHKSEAKNAVTLNSNVPTNTKSLTVVGCYPYFTNKANITKFAKEALTIEHKLSNVKFVAETSNNKHTFKIPDKYTVSKIEILNTMSGKFENYDINNFVVTTENVTVQSKQISYKVYTRNDGTNGESTFNITF